MCIVNMYMYVYLYNLYEMYKYRGKIMENGVLVKHHWQWLIVEYKYDKMINIHNNIPITNYLRDHFIREKFHRKKFSMRANL